MRGISGNPSAGRFPARHVQTSSATSDRYKSSRGRYLQWRGGVNPGGGARLVCTRQISIWKIHETYKCSCQSQLAPLTPLSFGLVASCRWRTGRRGGGGGERGRRYLPSVWCRVHARVSRKYGLPPRSFTIAPARGFNIYELSRHRGNSGFPSLSFSSRFNLPSYAPFKLSERVDFGEGIFGDVQCWTRYFICHFVEIFFIQLAILGIDLFVSRNKSIEKKCNKSIRWK